MPQLRPRFQVGLQKPTWLRMVLLEVARELEGQLHLLVAAPLMLLLLLLLAAHLQMAELAPELEGHLLVAAQIMMLQAQDLRPTVTILVWQCTVRENQLKPVSRTTRTIQTKSWPIGPLPTTRWLRNNAELLFHVSLTASEMLSPLDQPTLVMMASCF